jgi:hypothetical protein
MNKEEKRMDARIRDQFKRVKITKVKLGDEIEIHYEESDAELKASIILPANDKNMPTPEFKNALLELAPAVCEICEYDRKESPTITVKGISIAYKGEEKEKVMGVVITAMKKLLKTKASMLINTPYLPEIAKGGAAKLSPEAVTQVSEVIEHARLYLSGIRAQTQMEFKDEKQ